MIPTWPFRLLKERGISQHKSMQILEKGEGICQILY